MLNAKRALPPIAAAALAAAAIIPAASAGHTAPASHGAASGNPAAAMHTTEGERGALREARRATRRFRDLEAAQAAGYERVSDCEDDPKYGAMGIHYGNPELVSDGELDVSKPEILVYQPTGAGKLRLGAIEYFQADADQDLATDEDRPSMFGVPFDGPMLGHNPEMPIHYDLHVWLYRHNPAGLFAMWNPDVECPGNSAGHH